jgi:large subunit ribosomal protein L3
MKVFAKKIAMTQIFESNGRHRPVTVLALTKTFVVGKRTVQKDGYDATIVAKISDSKKIFKSLSGQFKGIENIARVCETKTSDQKIGAILDAGIFKEGDKIVVCGVSKGKGFAGTVKRHNFNTGPKTHGSNNYRRPGSIGPTYPQRTILGRRMAGHMGNENIKLKDVEVVKIEKQENRIWVRGSIPGANKTELIIEKND